LTQEKNVFIDACNLNVFKLDFNSGAGTIIMEKKYVCNRFRRQNAEIYNELRIMVELFDDIVGSLSSILNPISCKYYEYKLLHLDETYSWKRREKYIERCFMKREKSKVAMWMAMALQDIHKANESWIANIGEEGCPESLAARKFINKLHSMCFGAVEECRNFNFHYLAEEDMYISDDESEKNDDESSDDSDSDSKKDSNDKSKENNTEKEFIKDAFLLLPPQYSIVN